MYPTITLTSDFDVADISLGIVKAILVAQVSDCRIIDNVHGIGNYNLIQATYICKNTLPLYPAGTFHIILVDVYDRPHPKLFVALHNGSYYCCIDNGLLFSILGYTPENIVTLNTNGYLALQDIAMHFGQAINGLATGKKLFDIGSLTPTALAIKEVEPVLTETTISGHILHIDNFGNVVVNITKAQFEAQRKGRNIQILVSQNLTINKLSNIYSDVDNSTALAFFNSANYLEIAINKGNASKLLGLRNNLDKNAQANNLFFNKIIVEFT